MAREPRVAPAVEARRPPPPRDVLAVADRPWDVDPVTGAVEIDEARHVCGTLQDHSTRGTYRTDRLAQPGPATFPTARKGASLRGWVVLLEEGIDEGIHLVRDAALGLVSGSLEQGQLGV